MLMENTGIGQLVFPLPTGRSTYDLNALLGEEAKEAICAATYI